MTKKIFILFCFSVSSLLSYGQQTKKEKVHEVFLKYITNRLSLNSQEASQMGVLVPLYFDEMRAIHKNNSDPLIREQKKIALKIKYRSQIVPILGAQKANQLFIEEQLFRKKIKEELKQRKALVEE